MRRRLALRRSARRLLAPVLPAVRFLRRMPTVARGRAAAGRMRRAEPPVGADAPRVCFVAARFPDAPARRHEFANGGAVKLTYLAERFAHDPRRCHAVYAVSSVHHPAMASVVRAARRAGIPIVLNQNGVYYRGWFGDGWEAQNRPLAALHAAADVVLYQSEFCRRSAAAMLGGTRAEAHVLFNPVDLAHYRPRRAWDGAEPPVLLALACYEDRGYRLEAAVRTLARVRTRVRDARLHVPGFDPRRDRDAAMIARIRDWAAREGVPPDAVVFPPPFTRVGAPSVIGAAHVVVHAQYQDPSPNFVCEALACGVPVAYSASGGVPELVGDDAGIGVPVPESWDAVHVPPAEALADAVVALLDDWGARAVAARARAERLFGLDAYLAAHEAVFRRIAA